jgi:hypothetical protein
MFLLRSERKNNKSCNKNYIENTETLEKYINCIPIKKIIILQNCLVNLKTPTTVLFDGV